MVKIKFVRKLAHVFIIVFTLTQVNWHYSCCCSNLLDNETQGYCLFCFATWVYLQGNLKLERKLVSPLGHCIIVKRPSFNSLLSLFFLFFPVSFPFISFSFLSSALLFTRFSGSFGNSLLKINKPTIFFTLSCNKNRREANLVPRVSLL